MTPWSDDVAAALETIERLAADPVSLLLLRGVPRFPHVCPGAGCAICRWLLTAGVRKPTPEAGIATPQP